MFTSRQSNEIIIMLYVDATGGTLDRSACISFFVSKSRKVFCGHRLPSINWSRTRGLVPVQISWKLDYTLHAQPLRPVVASLQWVDSKTNFTKKKNQSLSIKSTHFVQVEILLSRKYPNLLRRLEYGRPKWKELFTSWKETYSRYTVEFFSHIIF